MEIKALIDRRNQIRLPSMLFNSRLGRSRVPITFLLDTGANITTILPVDALRVGIDFSKLNRSHNGVLGISGRQSVYELEDVILAFEKKEKRDFVFLGLETIHVIKPGKNSVQFPFSILGMDAIQKFHLDYFLPKVTITCKIRNVNGFDVIK